jgi:DNA-directed RNA polymerase specialized sigma24 family protein
MEKLRLSIGRNGEEIMAEWLILEKVKKYARLFVPEEEASDIALKTWGRMNASYPKSLNDYNLARLIAKRLALDWLRSQTRLISWDPALSETLIDPQNEYEAVDLWQSLRDGLSLEEITVLRLSYQVEMTLAEIARFMDRPLSTVASIRERALNKARKLLEEDTTSSFQ